MRRTAYALGIATMFIGMVVGCGKENKEGKESIRPESYYSFNEKSSQVIEASNFFGLALFGEMSLMSPDENSFISPISISAALALMVNGAVDTTKAELKKTLGVEKLTDVETGQGYRMLMDWLTHPSDVKIGMSFASSLWMRSGEPFNKAFVHDAENDYAADTFTYGNDNVATIKKMNKWVEERTDSKIKEVMKDIDGNSALYVLNAIDFEGAWTEPFNPQFTNRARFHVTGKADDDVFVQMMSRNGTFEYAKKPGFEEVRIPIGKKSPAYLAVLLPDENEGALSRLQAKLAAEPNLLTEPYERGQGTIDLPQVELNYSKSLNMPLKALGMKDAFDPTRANFSGIAKLQPLFIGKIDHFSSLVIDEQGVQAAAATKIEVLAGSAEPHNPFHITINRPFIVAIVDKETKAILFIGTIVSP